MPEPLAPADAARLYGKYGFFLLRRARTILRDAAAADDAVQHAFERILKAGGEVLSVEEPLRWLYRVVDRCCFDVLRSRRRSMARQSDEDVDTTAHPGIDHEARDAAMRVLASMNEEQMSICVLLFVDGMSQGEIAEELALSRVTVNKRVQSLRAWVNATLQDAARSGSSPLHSDGGFGGQNEPR